LYHDVEQALQVSNQQTAAILQPDAEQHQRYQQLFEHEYLRLQQLLEG
jgi:ribulose kinase